MHLRAAEVETRVRAYSRRLSQPVPPSNMALTQELPLYLTGTAGSQDGPRRFCQKCSAWHSLSAFRALQRSCTATLDKGVAQRAARRAARLSERDLSAGTAGAAASAAAAARAQPLSRHASSLLLPPPLPPLPSTAAGDEDSLDMGALLAAWGGDAADTDEVSMYVDELLFSNTAAAPHAPPAKQDAWEWASELALQRAPKSDTLFLKLDGALPGDLPSALRGSLDRALSDPLALYGHASPGCTLLTLDYVTSGGDAADAGQLACELLASPAAAFLRTQRWSLMCSRAAGDEALPAVTVAVGGGITSLSTPLYQLEGAARMPRLLPLALCTAGGQAMRLHCAEPLPHGCATWARLAGVLVDGLLVEADNGVITLTLPCPQEGCLLFALRESSAPPRPVLLVADAAAAAEVCTLASETDTGRAEALMALLGAALAPHAPPRLLRAAAGETLRRGWLALSSRLLAALLAAGGDIAPGLLHDAVASRCAPAAALVLALGGSANAFGCPATAAGRDGVTPLHLAALHPNGELAALLASHSPRAVIAWHCARARGATPAALAQSHPAHSGAAHCASNLAALMFAAAAMSRAAIAAAAVASPGSTAEQVLQAAIRARAAAASAAGAAGSDERLSALCLAVLRTALASREAANAAAAAPLSPSELAAYWRFTLASTRTQLLLVLPHYWLIDLCSCVALLRGSAPTAAQLAQLPNPPWAVAMAMYSWMSVPTLVLRLPLHALVTAVATLVPLREAYLRHGEALLAALTLGADLSTSWVEFRLRATYGDMFFPQASGMLVQLLLLYVLVCAVPNSLRVSMAALALRGFLLCACYRLPVYARFTAHARLDVLGSLLAVLALCGALRLRQETVRRAAWRKTHRVKKLA
jgi:hypothetical protein